MITGAEENVRRLIEDHARRCVPPAGAAAHDAIRSVGIVGAGLMGSAIGAAHLNRHLRVVLVDIDESALVRARQCIAAELADDLPRKEAEHLVSSLLMTSTAIDSVADCDLVLESIAENAAAKQRLYEKLEPQLSPHSVLASNTSAIPIARLAAKLAHPDRFVGFHFCHPVRHRPAVEVIRGPETSDRSFATILTHARSLGKMPIVVADGPGFMINRLLFVYLSEALSLVLEGATITQVEQAAIDFGMPLGPFAMLDEIGLDTSFHVGAVLADVFGDGSAGTPLLVQMVKTSQLGRKSKAGFFLYPGHTINPIASHLITQWSGTPQAHTADEITMRLFLPMVLEATRLLEEGKILNPADIDLGMIFGLGFPVSRGGLLWWASDLGAGRIIEMLRGIDSLGDRGRPTALLVELARSNRPFYTVGPQNS